MTVPPTRLRMHPRLLTRALAVAIAAGSPAALAAQAAGTAAPPPAAAPAAAPAPTASSAPRASWLSDRREFAVGDIITVFVDDYTIASAVKDNIATDRRRRNAGIDVAKPGPLAGSISAGIDSRNDGDSQQRGQARRENRFQSEMSVRVVALGPNGTMQVKGRKLIDVDKGQQDVTITGWLRAQDVSTGNVVESARLADAQVTYVSPGPLGKPKGGILSKVVGILWP
jgi:flagellar L-ring protein precursor FlgH